ncbi:MAG: DUF669 domain-containing protein [bacterium]
MATLNNFDANQVDPSVALDPLPADKYLAVVSESELKPTKTGGGKYLQLTFQIIDGEFKGRLVWARLPSVGQCAHSDVPADWGRASAIRSAPA